MSWTHNCALLRGMMCASLVWHSAWHLLWPSFVFLSHLYWENPTLCSLPNFCYIGLLPQKDCSLSRQILPGPNPGPLQLRPSLSGFLFREQTSCNESYQHQIVFFKTFISRFDMISNVISNFTGEVEKAQGFPQGPASHNIYHLPALHTSLITLKKKSRTQPPPPRMSGTKWNSVCVKGKASKDLQSRRSTKISLPFLPISLVLPWASPPTSSSRLMFSQKHLWNIRRAWLHLGCTGC